MSAQVQSVFTIAAQELRIFPDELLKQGTRVLLERQLREVKAEIYRITGRYGVASVNEMEERYRDGALEEVDSWQDLQRLDHLEYKRDRLLELLMTLS